MATIVLERAVRPIRPWQPPFKKVTSKSQVKPWYEYFYYKAARLLLHFLDWNNRKVNIYPILMFLKI